ncbi:hypothetical protein [Singulisphaera acidiphila]|nr:hypothetical protein [Singulisphaera acidiphila]
MDVRKAAAEVETGSVVHAYATGTMLQVFLLAQSVPATNWGEGDTNGGP